MQLYIDQGTNGFITDPLFKSPLPELSFKRGDDATINLTFVSGNTSLSAVSGIGLKFGIKQAGDYDGSPIVYTDEYTTAGTNYVLNPSFNTTALNSLLSGDVASVAGMLEVEWTISGVVASTNTQAVTINNDVIKNGENTPTVLPSPVSWLADNVIKIPATPYDLLVKSGPNVPLFMYKLSSGNVWTSDGLEDPALSGFWSKAYYNGTASQWHLELYEAGTMPAQDSLWIAPTNNPTSPPNGDWQVSESSDPDYVVANMLFKDQTILNTYRFISDGSVGLYVNIGALSGANQNWKQVSVFTIPDLTPP